MHNKKGTIITIRSEKEFLEHSYPLKVGDIIKEGDYTKIDSNSHWHKISSKFVGKQYQRNLGTLP